MRARLIVALALLGSAPALLGAVPAWAADPSGCDKFKWPVDRERAALTAADRPKLSSGADVPASAATLALTTPKDAKLPSPPERKSKDGTFAGFVSFKTAHTPGTYTISLSDTAWVDVVQDDEIQKPMEVSSATDCAGIRKTMKYDLSAGPFVVQVTGVSANAISLAVLPSQ